MFLRFVLTMGCSRSSSLYEQTAMNESDAYGMRKTREKPAAAGDTMAVHVREGMYAAHCNIRRSVIVTVALMLGTFALAGCSRSSSDSDGANGGGGTGGISAPGTVQKGLFNWIAVSVLLVNDQTGERTESDTVSVAINGAEFDVTAPEGSLVLLEATGEFVHELTGELIKVDKPMLALARVISSSINVNINIATHLSAVRTLHQLEANSQPVQPLIDANNAFVSEALGLPVPTDPTRLDLRAVSASSDMSDPNLLLLLLSAALVDSLHGNSLFADGFNIIADAMASAVLPVDLAGVLSELDGFGAEGLYDRLRLSGYSGNLPAINLPGDLLLDCSGGSTCNWLAQSVPSVSIISETLYEADGEAFISVRLSEPSSQPVEVRLAISEDTAHFAVDFGQVAATTVIPANSMSTVVGIPVIVDAESEDNEQFHVTLEVDSPAYTVRGSPATVTIVDGVPPGLADQDAATLELVELCVKATGNLVGFSIFDCTAALEPLSAVVPDRGDAAGVQIDLAAICTTANDCPALDTDWLVGFYLVADSAGVQQAENYLGSYVYANDSLQLTDDAGLPRNVLVALAGTAGASFIADAAINDWSLRLEARLGGASVAAGVAEMPTLVALPEALQAGDRLVPIGEIHALVPGDGGNCPVGTYELTAEFVVSSREQSQASTAGGTVCTGVSVTAGGDISAALVDGSVDLAGTVLDLAPFHIAFPAVRNTAPPLPVAFQMLPILAETDADGNPEENGVLLHAEGLPFYFYVAGGALTAEGVEIEFDDMRHVMDIGYSSQDPRSGGGFATNDAFYAGVTGQAGTLRLDAAGTLSGAFTVAAGMGSTAFPKGEIQWATFSQTIENSAVSGMAATDVTFEMRQSTACASLDCVAGTDLVYVIQADDSVIDSRGVTLGVAEHAAQAPVTPGWGADAAGGLAFSRPDDLVQADATMTLALPGYRLPHRDAGRIADYLLSHVEAGTAGSIEHTAHALGTAAANDGNWYPIGISAGPEIYRNDQGIPATGAGQNLAGNAFSVSDGDNAANVGSSIATKYVVRNSGITGAFNADPLSLQSPIEFRGYRMQFERFAVRLVDNALDTYNWIDGSLVLHGDAGGPSSGDGLRLVFSNLEMNCSARFGNANLVFEQCDGIDNNSNNLVDENCDHRLASWRADTDIFSMRFNDAQSCTTGTQLLALQQQVKFNALNDPIGVDARWTSDGTLDNHNALTPESIKLDTLADGSKGFSIRPRSIVLEVEDVPTAADGRYGFAEMRDVLIGVPFWNALNADVRLANRISINQTVAEPTVIVTDLTAQPRAQSNYEIQQAVIADSSSDITARYEWGSTGFGFQLPVYYSPEVFNGDQPQFIGRRKSVDLFVLEAGAGINYIDPERTKLSFGASADIDALKSVTFQVDLANRDTLRKVDDMLVSLSIVDRPVLEPGLGDLNDKLGIVNNLAGNGITGAMQNGLEVALEEIGGALPGDEDPFELASSLLSQVKSYPQQVLTILDDEVKGNVDAVLRSQRSNLGFQLALFENELLQIGSGEDWPEAFLDTMDLTIESLHRTEQLATDATGAVRRTADDVEAMILSTRSAISVLHGALDDIDQVVTQAVSFSQSACTSGNLTPDSAGYLSQLQNRLVTVRSIFDLVQGNEVLVPLAELLVSDPELNERITQTLEGIRTQSEELESYLTSAEEVLRDLVCDERNFELLADVRVILDRIRSDTTIVNVFVTRAAASVQDINLIADRFDEELLPRIRLMRIVLADFRDSLGAVAAESGSMLLVNLELALAEASGINALVADPTNPSERDVLTVVFDPVRDTVDTLYADLRADLESEVAGLLPGAYYSAEQLRRMFVAAIMDSAPVVDLRIRVNDYLSEINFRLNNLVLMLVDQLNTSVGAAIAKVEEAVNDALSAATAPVRNIPLDSAKLDGFAVIAGNELERARVAAEWTMSPSAEGEKGSTFGASLEAVSWSANNKAAGCGVGDDSSRLDVTIAAMGLPANILSSDILIKKIYLGFTLGSAPGRLVPRGVFGGISTDGDIGFSEAIVYDPAFVAGIGDVETYIGASAGAVFSDIQAEVAFLVGRTCNTEILAELDPRVGEFITLPPSGFGGAYLRGGATIPLLTLGCPLTVGVGADFGAWILAGPPATFGGLVGGSAYGKVACVGALRGQILAIGQINTDGELFFSGQGFGAAGVGLCEPETWTTKEKSRQDGLCGTGDASFIATFDKGKWLIPKPSIGAIY